MKQLKYKQSSFDECIFTKGKLIFFFYVDDGVFLYPDKSKVDDTIQELRDAKLEREDQGDLTYYLGINFTYQKDGSIIMSQPQLIDQIIQDVKLMANSHLSSTPAAASKLLQRDQKAKPFNGRFHYRPPHLPSYNNFSSFEVKSRGMSRATLFRPELLLDFLSAILPFGLMFLRFTEVSTTG